MWGYFFIKEKDENLIKLENLFNEIKNPIYNIYYKKIYSLNLNKLLEENNQD